MGVNEVESPNKLLEQGYKAYYGEDIIVFFNKDLCQHLAFCVCANEEVFNINQKPWINLENACANEVASICDRCSSGALKYYKGENLYELYRGEK